MNLGNVFNASLFRNPMLTTEGQKTSNESTTSSVFQTMLWNDTARTEETDNLEVVKIENVEEVDFDDWWYRLYQLINGSDNETDQSTVGDPSLDDTINWSSEEILTLIEQLSDQNWSQGEIEVIVKQLVEGKTALSDTSVNEKLLELLNQEKAVDFSELKKMIAVESQTNDEAKKIPFQQITGNAKHILQSIQTSGDWENQAKALLNLLQQWSQLRQKEGSLTDTVIESTFTDNKDSDELDTWKELLTVYKRRTQLVQNRQYSSNAKVTRNDVMKWLRQLMPNSQHTGDKGITHHVASFPSTPMSQVEQYVIHIEQGSQSDLPYKQLIDQLQKIIHSSRFLTSMNGTNQLSLSLHPESLGDMTIKVMQVNGELTAKILVSSLAAKEMFEANLHQLKHMFSPHQVVIERTDVSPASQHSMNEEGEESHTEQDEGQGNSDESSDGRRESLNEDFEAFMEELI